MRCGGGLQRRRFTPRLTRLRKRRESEKELDSRDFSLPLLRNQPSRSVSVGLAADYPRRIFLLMHRTRRVYTRARLSNPLATRAHSHATNTHVGTRACGKKEAPGACEIVARGLRAYQIGADYLNFSSSARAIPWISRPRSRDEEKVCSTH